MIKQKQRGSKTKTELENFDILSLKKMSLLAMKAMFGQPLKPPARVN